MKHRILIVLAIMALGILLALGYWQFQRMHWKEALIADIAERTAMEPLPLNNLLNLRIARDALEYRNVTVIGRFIGEKAQFVLSTYDGASGWNVYEPFKTEQDQIVIINRGFIPYDKRDDGAWASGSRRIEVTGLFRNPLSEKPSSLVPDNAPSERTYYWKDLTAMVRAMDLGNADVLPVFVDLKTPATANSVPVPSVTQFDLPNNHFQYMLTWWGLAFALACVFLVYLRQGPKALTAAKPKANHD